MAPRLVSRAGRRYRPRVEGLEDRRSLSVSGGLTVGADGALWFSEGDKVGRITTSGVVTEFPLNGLGFRSQNIGAGPLTAGPDGALWFPAPSFAGVSSELKGIGRVTTSGAVTGFALPGSDQQLTGAVGALTVGPDGDLWFPFGAVQTPVEETGAGIGRITTSGAITEFRPPGVWNLPGVLTVGSDGNLWFTEAPTPRVARITPGGVVTEFPVSSNGPLTAGPDGALWFPQGYDVGRITTSGVVTEFPLPGNRGLQGPLADSPLTVGPDGNLWFFEEQINQGGTGLTAVTLGRITTSGAITEFPLPTPGIDNGRLTVGPDGDLWFPERDKIGRATTSGAITEFPLPTPGASPGDLTVGPDGALWFPEGDKIGRITTSGAVNEFPITAPLPPPPPPTVEGLRRSGVHRQPTRLVLTVSEPLAPARAQDTRNYGLFAADRAGRPLGRHPRPIPIASAVYDPSTRTVTLTPVRRLNLHRYYRLTVNGSARSGLAGLGGALDGSWAGHPGSDYVAVVHGLGAATAPAR